MITINLISPGQKKNLEKQKVFAAVCRSVAVIFIFTAVFSGLLLGSKYYLELRLSGILSQNAREINNVRDLALSIKKINSQIDAVSNIQNEYYRWSPLLVELAKLTPAEISFAEINLYKQEGMIEITGLAKTRNDLISYQKLLENSGWFKKVDLPLEALIGKENNNFSIKASLDLNKAASL